MIELFLVPRICISRVLSDVLAICRSGVKELTRKLVSKTGLLRFSTALSKGIIDGNCQDYNGVCNGQGK
jgi:TPP-dependent 2-oxoacid decarboxylase